MHHAEHPALTSSAAQTPKPHPTGGARVTVAQQDPSRLQSIPKEGPTTPQFNHKGAKKDARGRVAKHSAPLNGLKRAANPAPPGNNFAPTTGQGPEQDGFSGSSGAPDMC